MRVVLLTNSCTTGWMQWGHGELWLTPDSLVRIGRKKLTARAALEGGAGSALGAVAGPIGHLAALVGGGLWTRQRDRRDLGRVADVEHAAWVLDLMQRRDDVLAIPLRWITRADVRSGLSTTRLRLHTVDGAEHTLLWLNNAVAVPVLRTVLDERLNAS